MLEPVVESDFGSILQINQAAQPGVVSLSPPELSQINRTATVFCALKEGSSCRAYVIAYENTRAYDGEEFCWLQKNVADRFLYIDQVAVASDFRGRGIGTKVYEFLERFAVMNDFASLACEVNIDPSNLASLRFHLHRGFRELGELRTSDGREVRLMQKSPL